MIVSHPGTPGPATLARLGIGSSCSLATHGFPKCLPASQAPAGCECRGRGGSSCWGLRPDILHSENPPTPHSQPTPTCPRRKTERGRVRLGQRSGGTGTAGGIWPRSLLFQYSALALCHTMPGTPPLPGRSRGASRQEGAPGPQPRSPGWRYDPHPLASGNCLWEGAGGGRCLRTEPPCWG